MPQKHIQSTPAGDKYKEDIARAEHGMRGDTMGITAKITFVIALCWSLFQMASASVLLIDSIYVKSIHLAFAITLVYFNIPMLKPSASSRWDLRILLAMNRVTVMDYILGIMAAVAALYIFLDYAGLSSRPGSPNDRDILMGILLVVLILLLARQTGLLVDPAAMSGSYVVPILQRFLPL